MAVQQRTIQSTLTGRSPRPRLLCLSIAGTILLLAVQESGAEDVLVFRDTEDMILDGAPAGVDSYSPAVAVNHVDQAAVVWSDTQEGPVDTLMGLFSRSLESLSDIVYVNELFEDTTSRAPRVVGGEDNAFTIVWSDNRSIENLFDVFLTRINDSMEKLFDDTRANEAFEDTNVQTPDVASISGGLICVCWVDDRQSLRDVYARRFWESGAPVDGGDFMVNPGYEGTNAGHPRVSGDADGTAVIVWSDDRVLIPGPPQDSRNDIYARILPRSAIANEEGTWPGLDFELQVSDDDLGSDDALDPAIAGNGHGLYVVAWCNQTSDGRDQHIYAAVITSSGLRLTDEFQVDLTSSPASTADPGVTFLAHDVFLITWYDDREDGIIAGGIYDAAINQFVSIEFVVTDIVGPVAGPVVAPFSDRAFVTAWAHGQSGERDVLGNVHFWDLLGDLNVDARVSANDLYTFASRWQPKTTSTTAADLDADGFVDGSDIRILRQEFRTNLADRQPLTFSAASLAKRGTGRKISVMKAEPTRLYTEKPRREDRTKRRREPTPLTSIIPGGQAPPGSQEDFRLEKPIRVRSPRATMDGGMNSQPSRAAQNQETLEENQIPREGFLFLRGKRRWPP